jgi:orotate phosphoribosyltransferase
MIHTAGLTFPEDYIRRGEFKLHSGGKSDTFYDVNSMLCNRHWLNEILKHIPESRHYVGIPTGGAILAGIVAQNRHSNYSIIHDEMIKGTVPEDSCLLIDDVVTTTNSFVSGVEILKKAGVDEGKIQYFSVLDRRAQGLRQFIVNSVFDVGESSVVS